MWNDPIIEEWHRIRKKLLAEAKGVSSAVNRQTNGAKRPSNAVNNKGAYDGI
ncbi:MAG: hypothetical protein ACKVQK_17120 [Burkholderiales bacterium]